MGNTMKFVIVAVVAIALLVVFLGPMLSSVTITVSAATDYLEDRGYAVFTPAQFDLLAKEATAYAAVLNAEAAVTAAQTTLETLLLHNENEVFLWPESVLDTCTLQAGVATDTFGNWTEIIDNHGVKLSANFTSTDGYLVEIMTHDYSSLAYDTVIIELATDAAGANVIGRAKVITDWTYIVALRSVVIPHGSLLYYRMKSETGNSTLQTDFRYYYK